MASMESKISAPFFPDPAWKKRKPTASNQPGAGCAPPYTRATSKRPNCFAKVMISSLKQGLMLSPSTKRAIGDAKLCSSLMFSNLRIDGLRTCQKLVLKLIQPRPMSAMRDLYRSGLSAGKGRLWADLSIGSTVDHRRCSSRPNSSGKPDALRSERCTNSGEPDKAESGGSDDGPEPTARA